MQDYKKLMAKARKTNAKRDRQEAAAGYHVPGGHLERDGLDLTALMLLRNAMSAIEAGIGCEDWSCVAEGQAMLEKLHPMVDPKGRPVAQ